jgi:hypothetical protein
MNGKVIDSWADDLESRNPNLVVGKPRILPYNPSLFFDVNHLNPTGARQFTTFAADEVKQVLQLVGSDDGK